MIIVTFREMPRVILDPSLMLNNLEILNKIKPDPVQGQGCRKSVSTQWVWALPGVSGPIIHGRGCVAPSSPRQARDREIETERDSEREAKITLGIS